MLSPNPITTVEALKHHAPDETLPLLLPRSTGEPDHKLILHRACDKLLRLQAFYNRVTGYCHQELKRETDPLRITQLTERKQMAERFKSDLSFVTARCMQFLPPEEKRAINDLVFKHERHFDGPPPGNLR